MAAETPPVGWSSAPLPTQVPAAGALQATWPSQQTYAPLVTPHNGVGPARALHTTPYNDGHATAALQPAAVSLGGTTAAHAAPAAMSRPVAPPHKLDLVDDLLHAAGV